MKRLAVLMAMACLALPAMAGAQGHDHRGGGGRGEVHGDGRGRGGGYPGGGYHPAQGGPPGPGYGPGPAPRYAPGYGFGYPDPRRGGYPGPRFGGGGPGHSYRFVRGQLLPPDYRGEVVSDYGRYHLRRPPRGYYWYRAGDDFVLAALGSGLIFEVIDAEGY